MSRNGVAVSIVLATKDRYETLYDCVRGLLRNYADTPVEIIVRDNSTEPCATAFEAEFGSYPNVRYFADSTPVSQSENYEAALAQSRGDYVTMIGDDDGIAWGLLELAAWMDRYRVDAFFPGFSVYLWPGTNGRLSVPNETGVLYYETKSAPMKLVKASVEREKVFAGGCTGLENMPRLYYGLVRKSCLDSVREKAGYCFPGPSPDMANAMSLSTVVSRYVVSSLPIFISGNSQKSNAGLGLRGRHVGEIDQLPFLPGDTAKHWHPHIPYFWSGQTIWCQSAYTACHAMGIGAEFDLANNFRQLYARLLVFQPLYSGRTLRAMSLRFKRLPLRAGLLEALGILGLVVQLWLARIVTFLRSRLGRLRPGSSGVREMRGFATVSSATVEVDRVMHAMELERWLEHAMVQIVQDDGAAQP